MHSARDGSVSPAARSTPPSSPLPSLTQFLNIPATQDHSASLTQASADGRRMVREQLYVASSQDRSARATTPPAEDDTSAVASRSSPLCSSPAPRSIGPWVQATAPQQPGPGHEGLSRSISTRTESTHPDATPKMDADAGAEPTLAVGMGQASSQSSWTLRDELRNTPAHFYLGPLPGAEVLRLLGTVSISAHARTALTGTTSGYLKYFHFEGVGPIPSSRQRPSKRRRTLATNTSTSNPTAAALPTSSLGTPVASGSTEWVPVTPPAAESSGPPADEGSGSASFAEDTALGGVLALLQAAESTRERWRCRLCHRYLHVPASSVANLGAHLFGSRKLSKAGCLDMRADSPSEPVPPPARDASGSLIRIGPDSAVPSSRSSRLPPT
ncbi:hypothetical protein V8E36_003348 [Tilletia maclaganii]